MIKLLLARCKAQGSCLIWLGALDRDGYGRIGFKYKQYIVHRFMYELVKGPIPEGMVVMHSCDTPNCIQPDHLSVGTQWDNLVDARRKLHYSCPVNGSQHHNARLTETQVLEIRASNASQAELARRFNVSTETVRKVILRQTWNHLK